MPLQLGVLLNTSNLLQLIYQALQNLLANLCMSHFPSPKHDSRLYFVFPLQEADDVIFLELIIVCINLGPELHLLELNALLVLLGLLCLFALLVPILPVVHDPADRRFGHRCDFYQVQPFVQGQDKGPLWLHYSQLAAIVINDSDFASPDSLIYSSSPNTVPPRPNLRFCRLFINKILN